MNLVILEHVALYLPLLLGSYISFVLMKIPSLSIESAYVFGAVAASWIVMMDSNQDLLVLILALMVSFIGGALVGMMAALFSQKAKFSHLLSAIITIGFFHGIVQWSMAGSHLQLPTDHNVLRYFAWIPQYPELVMVCLIALLVLMLVYYFLQTELGVSCAIYGDNPHFLRNYRIHQSYVVTIGLAMSNGLVGISGYLIAQSNGFVDLSMGSGIPLFCISSLIIGKSLCWNLKSIIQILIPITGVAGYFMLQFFLLKFGFDLRYFTLVQATIVAILLMTLSRWSSGSSVQDSLGL